MKSVSRPGNATLTTPIIGANSVGQSLLREGLYETGEVKCLGISSNWFSGSGREILIQIGKKIFWSKISG